MRPITDAQKQEVLEMASQGWKPRHIARWTQLEEGRVKALLAESGPTVQRLAAPAGSRSLWLDAPLLNQIERAAAARTAGGAL